MPVKWTADLDRRLLLLALELVKVDNKKIAALWASKYGNGGGEQPTPRAITERLVVLKKSAISGNGGKINVSSGGNNSPRNPAATPKSNTKKPIIPKTPSSGTKRGHKAMSEDDDDSEGENTTPSGAGMEKRTKYDRRSKTPKVYEDSGSDHEAADGKEAGSSFGGIFNQDLNLDGASERPSGFTSRRKMLDVDAMSDVSDFKPEQDEFY